MSEIINRDIPPVKGMIKVCVQFVRWSILIISGFTEDSVPLVAAYCLMFVIAAAGNLSVIITLFRSKRHRRSRISLMISHLAVADLIVAFFMIPLEVRFSLILKNFDLISRECYRVCTVSKHFNTHSSTEEL